MDEITQSPRQGITVTQNTAIRQTAGNAAVINPYTARSPIEKPMYNKATTPNTDKNTGGITVTQNTGIRRDAEKESIPINVYMARTAVKSEASALHNPSRLTVMNEVRNTAKDKLKAQNDVGASTIAAYIVVVGAAITTWQLAQAASPAAIGGAKVTLKVVKGTFRVAKKTFIFTVTPVESTRELILNTKKAILNAAARVKVKIDAAATGAKKAYTVVRGVLTGTITLPPNLPQKMIKGVFKGVRYTGKAMLKTTFKAGVKGIKMGGAAMVTAGNYAARYEDAGARSVAGAINAGKYTVEAAKLTPKAAKGVYTAGKTTVMVPVKIVKGTVAVTKGTVAVVKSVKNNGWAKTAGKVGKKLKNAAANTVKAIGNTIKIIVKGAVRKIAVPLILIVLGFILIFQVISIPVQAGGILFSKIFSIFSPDTGDSIETDVHEYVSNAATAARERYIQAILDEANANLKSHGGQYDFVRLYKGVGYDDQVKDGMALDLSAISASIYTIDELTNLAEPIFNAVILTKYSLEPTETEARYTVNEIMDTLLKYKTQSMATEWCEYDGEPTTPRVCDCGQVHADWGCPNSISGYHSSMTCRRCDSITYTLTYDEDGEAYETADFYCSGYDYCQGHSILGIFIIEDGWYALIYKYFQQRIDELSSREPRAQEEETELQTLKDGYELAMIYINEARLSFSDLSISDLSGVNFLPGERPGNPAIPEYAEQFVGNVGGQIFWSWYGFASREEWCGCFVSYVLNRNGYSEPKYASCEAGAKWFKDHGQWYAGAGYAAAAGDIIFFDWEGKGETHHTGIVIGHDEEYVYTVEGNSANDMCRLKKYPINSSVIFGYGLPNY